MSKNKKIIIGVIIVLLIIFIGVFVEYKVIEKSVTDREDFKFNVENISSNPVDTENIEIEYEGQIVTITNKEDKEIIEHILVNSKYDNEICSGINTHKITLNNEIYYIKEDCKEIQKGNKQANITTEDLETINNIISKKINDESNNITNISPNNNIPVNEIIGIE